MNFEKIIADSIKDNATKKELSVILNTLFGSDLETISVILSQLNDENSLKLVKRYNSQVMDIEDFFHYAIHLLDKQGDIFIK